MSQERPSQADQVPQAGSHMKETAPQGDTPAPSPSPAKDEACAVTTPTEKEKETAIQEAMETKNQRDNLELDVGRVRIDFLENVLRADSQYREALTAMSGERDFIVRAAKNNVEWMKAEYERKYGTQL